MPGLADALPEAVYVAIQEAPANTIRGNNLGVPAFNKALTPAEVAAMVQPFISGGGGGSLAWADITGKPSVFAPDTHSHSIADVTGLQTALDNSASVISGTATVTIVSTSGLLEHSQVVALSGVTSSSRVQLSLAPHLDDDENSHEMLDVVSLTAIPSTDQFEVYAAFSQPTSGPVKLNYMVI